MDELDKSLMTLEYSRPKNVLGSWQGSNSDIVTEPNQIQQIIREVSKPCFLVDFQDQIGVCQGGVFSTDKEISGSIPVVGVLNSISPDLFGDADFTNSHGIKSPYMAGAMANAISGIDLVTAMGKAGYLASYGSGGVSPARLLEAIQEIKKQLPEGPFAFNLIHSPQESELEQKTVDLFLEHNVQTIEASAFLRLTPTVVQYRTAGLELDPAGQIRPTNKVIAKLSRHEVALQFLDPAPEKILSQLVDQNKITPEQANMAAEVPIADDITVEADSGGHTDNRPLVGLLPSIIALRNQNQQKNNYGAPVRIGAGGGIGTPESVLGAFALGAAYVVTGSINQSCLEAGTSPEVKQALAQAAAPDVMMAPSADMFEMGVKVQVLKRGSMFPMRAQKLYDIYLNNQSIGDIPPADRKEIEEKIFQNDLEVIWDECVKFFNERDPDQITKADGNPKKKMALIFRWYLGLATHWGIQGVAERKLDYQIWCGPSMGAFNDWVRGTDLEKPENRSVVRVADELMLGAAYRSRINDLSLQGIKIPTSWERYLEN
jgi:PfaD family protein